ncbi:MAG: OmpA family protein [Bacteroidetes bacterium]|nr:OmpA family protein [Bacteroidota bacterium]
MKVVHRSILLFLLILVSACKPTKFVIKDGKTAVELKLFNESLDFLLKEFNAEKDPIKQQPKAFAVAESYRKFNDLANAEKWYQKCLDLNGGSQALFMLAMMQKQQEKYAEAYNNFEKFQRISSGGFEGRKQANQCREALEWKKEFSRISVTNIEAINSSASDYSLRPFKPNQFVFSSSRDQATGSGRDGWTGEKFSDIFVTELKAGSFTPPTSFATTLNTDAHESSPTFSKDFKEIYFIRCKPEDQSNQFCHLYYSAFNNEHWNEPVRVDVFPDTVNVYDPFLSPDGNLLLLSSDAPGGFGGTDLYLFNKIDTGWSAPINLGGSINTPESERFPWLDEKYNLYFSSNGLPGMGGLDIFKSARVKNSFREPINLKYPINSGADDFAFYIDKYKPDTENDTILFSGYFSSSRAGGKGKDDLYRFEERWLNLFVLRGKVLEKKYENPENPDSKVLGLKTLPKAKVELKMADERILNAAFSDTGGNFIFRLEAETDYKITAGKNGYFSNNTLITTKGKRNKDSTYINLYTQIELDKIFTQKMIVIPNIYYDYDKATLRPESKLVLDSIMIFFKDNPDLTIEIGSHTDSRGSDEYNQKLSQARAQSVVDYLVEKQIPKDRLIAKGYGETAPVNQCRNGVNCTEDEHQKNRRTTFRVASAKLNLESIEPEDIKVVPKE